MNTEWATFLVNGEVQGDVWERSVHHKKHTNNLRAIALRALFPIGLWQDRKNPNVVWLMFSSSFRFLELKVPCPHNLACEAFKVHCLPGRCGVLLPPICAPQFSQLITPPPLFKWAVSK